MDIKVGNFVLVNTAWLHVDDVMDDGTIWALDSDGNDFEIAIGEVEAVK